MQLHNPKWIEEILGDSGHSPVDRIYAINKKLNQLVNASPPLVSVVIPIKNEEANILNCVDSIARNKSVYDVEIIIVNNNSTDRSSEILNKLNVKVYNQPADGVGATRQLGLEVARGKIILTADADCLYHSDWIESMVVSFKGDGVVCVAGSYKFIGNHTTKRWQLELYETLRNLIIYFRSKKHPYLNVRGGCMGYLKDSALKFGYDTRDLRGEDGRLSYDLMTIGKLIFNKKTGGHVWTYVKYGKDNAVGLLPSIKSNLQKEFWRSLSYLKTPRIHNTKKSLNTPNSIAQVVKFWMEKDKENER